MKSFITSEPGLLNVVEIGMYASVVTISDHLRKLKQVPSRRSCHSEILAY